MKYSEALREGAKQAEQIQGSYLQMDCGVPKACAIGAIYLGYGFTESTTPCWVFASRIPEGIAMIIVRMNDEEEKSFEEIAQWLEEQGL
jgi:hypothetical protein